ncbi:MAG TPA: site-2 protease family protein [Bryobacteraceae bacterium]|nr:site-2 protease family protein [Bryobacteraceae bacterium]
MGADWQRPRSMQRWWLHGLLLLVTALTTTMAGAGLAANFTANQPAFIFDRDIPFLLGLWSEPRLLLAGLPFSLTLLSILLAHELGHYWACWFHRIEASLPYFLPAPTLIGTFGAFIRIRSPIYSRRELFDVGIAGPLAGFVFLAPALGIGLAYSKVVPGIAEQGDLVFGSPLLVWLAAKVVFPGVAAGDLYLHPVARAAWVGLLATALNLLPIGQLDGGHILYAFVGRQHRRLSQVFAVLLAAAGVWSGWYAWLLWAAFFLWTGLRHPPIVDESPLDGGRIRLALLAAAILAISFTPAPVRGALSL